MRLAVKTLKCFLIFFHLCYITLTKASGAENPQRCRWLNKLKANWKQCLQKLWLSCVSVLHVSIPFKCSEWAILLLKSVGILLLTWKQKTVCHCFWNSPRGLEGNLCVLTVGGGMLLAGRSLRKLKALFSGSFSSVMYHQVEHQVTFLKYGTCPADISWAEWIPQPSPSGNWKQECWQLLSTLTSSS